MKEKRSWKPYSIALNVVVAGSLPVYAEVCKYLAVRISKNFATIAGTLPSIIGAEGIVACAVDAVATGYRIVVHSRKCLRAWLLLVRIERK